MNPSAKRSAAWSQHWQDIASPELTATLTAMGTSRRLGGGQMLYAKGDPGDALYGVQSGLIRMISAGKDGSESLLGLYAPGTWFGEISLFDELPRPASAYAVGDTELLVVSAAALREVLGRHPAWYRDFARVLCNKLRLTLEHMEDEALPTSVRIVQRLLDLGQAYGQTGPGGVVIGLKLPQEDLGRMLRLSRQSVNKELRALETRGWLRIRRGEISLLAMDALRRHVRDGGG